MKKVIKKYWAFDPVYNKYEFFDDIDERNEFVKELIDDCKDEDDIWDDDLLNEISIGEGIETHHVVQTDVKYRPDDLDQYLMDKDGFYWPNNYDYICNYEMKKIKG